MTDDPLAPAFLLIGGLAVVCFGLAAAFKFRAPWADIFSTLIPVGAALALLGVLLAAVPGFFS